MICHACTRELNFKSKIGRRDECPFCRADLHCCANCRYYDRSASKQCREPVSEFVKEKVKANFCDYFVFADKPDTGTAGEQGARKKIDELFKK